MDATCKPVDMKRLSTPETDIGRLCFLIAKDLRTVLNRSFAEFDLSAQQAAALMQCYRQPGASPSDLASAVGTDTAGITGLIDQLEKNGLVARRPHASDRRAIVVEPTKTGRALAPKLSSVFRDVHHGLLAGYSADQTAKLEAMLERLRKNIRELIMEYSDAKVETR
jgi:DNA-binding MarR family transcriptional regulator